MSNNVICWYYFSYDTSVIGNLTISLSYSRNTTTEVYLEKTNSNFTYKGSISSSMAVSYSSTSDKYIWVLISPSDSNSYSSFSVVANAKTVTNTTTGSSTSSSSDSETIIIIVVVISALVCIAIIAGAIIICVICKVKARRNRQPAYLENSEQNMQDNNFRAADDNNLFDQNIIAIGQSRDNMSASPPSIFHPNFEYSNSKGISKTQYWINKNHLNQDELEIGVPVQINIQETNGSQILEGRRIQHHSDNTVDGGEMPVYKAK